MEDPKHLLRRDRHPSRTIQGKDHDEAHAERPAKVLMREDKDVENIFYAVTDQVVSEECTAYLEAGPFTRLASDQILVRAEGKGIPIHVEESSIGC